MLPIEAHAPHLVRFLTEGRAFPRPRPALAGAAPAIPLAGALAFALGLLVTGHPALFLLAMVALGGGLLLLLLRHERAMPAGERRHRAAWGVRERLRGMLTLRRLHRALDPGVLALVDEGARRYLLARGHAAKMAHPLLARADAGAVAAMDDLLLEIAVNLPERPASRSFADSVADGLGGSPLAQGVGRFLGASGPPPPDFDAMRRVRPHVQALADLADEIERTLPSLARDLDLPGGEPPLSQTLGALREHREAAEGLEREMRLGG